MLILAHSTVGLLIGTVVPNPVFSFLLAWISHYVLDFIPHSDTGYFKSIGRDWLKNKKIIAWVFLDAIVSLLVLGLFIKSKGFNLSLLTGYLGSLGPDILDNSPFWGRALRKIPVVRWEYEKIHNNFHNTLKKRKSFIYGIILSYIINGILLFLLLK